MDDIRYFIVSRADLTDALMDKCYIKNPYNLVTNIANTKVVFPCFLHDIPTEFFVDDEDVYTEEEIAEYIADTDNGFTVADQETYADSKNYTLDGVSKSISGAIDLGGTTKYTISLWASANLASTRGEYVFGIYDDSDKTLSLRRYTDGNWYIYNYDGTSNGSKFTSSAANAVNGLNHILLVFDSTETEIIDRVKMWINGTEEVMTCGPQEGPTSTYSFVENFVVGCDREGTGSHFLGSIRDMAIWNSAALDSDDAATIYNNGTPCDVRSLEPDYYYWFGDSATDDENMVTDLMGNVDLTTNNIVAGDINDN